MAFVKVVSAGSVIGGSFISPKDELINTETITNIKKHEEKALVYYMVYTTGTSSILSSSEAKKIFEAIGVSL
jgi:hypothetical protein